jgi:nucleotide-binding universal stress UspA family protein/amino acid permease
LGSLLGYQVPQIALKVIAILIVLSLTSLNCKGTQGGDRFQKVFTWGNLVVLSILIFSAVPEADPARLKPMFPNGVEGMASAIAIIYISFFGYQLIANNAEEIVEPRRTVPKAMLLSMLVSLVFYVLIAFVAVLVVPWKSLSAAQAPLVELASRSLGSFGWLLIALGGVLASAAALNSTLLSQGRQIYAMGRHGFLPSLLGRIHETRRTPNAALLAGGIVTATAVAVGELEFIAKSANFCFITSLVAVALALNRLQRKSSERTHLVKKALPVVAFLTNVGLLFTLDWVSFFFGLNLLAAGCVVFLFYSRARESRAKVGMSVVLSDQKEPILRRGSRILVPMANPMTQEALLSLSQGLLAAKGGEIAVLSVVTAPEQVDFYSVLGDSESAVEILEKSTQIERAINTRLRPLVRVSRSLARGIVDAAEEQGCEIIVMGYEGQESDRSSSLMEELLRHTRTDLILLKVKDEFKPRKIAVSIVGTENLDLMVRLAGATANQFGGTITFLNILPREYTPAQKAHTDKIFAEAIKRHTGTALYKTEVLASDDPLGLLLERSSQFDLLILGSSRVGLFEKIVVGAFAARIVERSRCSVAVVRTIPPSRKTLSRVLRS